MRRSNLKISSKSPLWGVGGFSFLNFLLFLDLLWSGKEQVLSSSQTDLYLHFVAWRQFSFEQLLHGHLVLWNPYYLCGAPFLGGFESAMLYPPNWLYLVLPLGIAINTGIILHIILAGFFTFLWGLKRGFHPLGAFLGGTIFMWGGAYFLHLFAGHLPNLCAMVWAPLLFLSIDGLAEKISMRWILLGIFAVSMQILAGHPQYVYFTFIIGIVYTGVNLWGAKSKLKLATVFAVLYLGSGLLTAIQLWTGFQVFGECGRSIPLEINSASSFSFPPENLLTLFLPNFFGNLTTAPYWGQWYLWEVSLFIGVGGFFLCYFGITTEKVRQVLWILLPALVALILAFGAYTPLYGLIYNFAPFFKGFRGICKFGFIVSLFFAMSAGMGMSHLLRSPKPTRRAFFFCLSGGVVLSTLGLLIHFSLKDGLAGFWGRWFLSLHWLAKAVVQMPLDQRLTYSFEAGTNSARSLALGGISFFILSLLLVLRKWRPQATYGIAVFCILELFLFARANRPTFDLSPLQKKFDALRDFYAKNPGDYRVYGTTSASLETGGHDIWEDEPMVLGRYGRFVCFSQGLSENQLFSVVPIFQKFPPQLGMLRLKYRVFPEEDPIRIAPFPLKTLPRMLLVDNWEVLSDAKGILPALFGPQFDPTQKVYLEREPGLTITPGKVKGSLEWKDLSTEIISIDASVSKDCLLLITDNYSSGWRVRGLADEDAADLKLLPADYFLRGIPLKAGKHHFLLEYRPTAFEIGKWVSFVSCIIYAVLVYFAFRKRSIFEMKA